MSSTLDNPSQQTTELFALSFSFSFATLQSRVQMKIASGLGASGRDEKSRSRNPVICDFPLRLL